ncbi:exported hypothetical protein [Bradyrhizobium sp. STM 3843]|nr:exported hypothetical protein [Bradyrhizobium sp. STM 3843]
MKTVLTLLATWIGLNLAFPAFALWQRSPMLRRQLIDRALQLAALSPHPRTPVAITVARRRR